MTVRERRTFSLGLLLLIIGLCIDARWYFVAPHLKGSLLMLANLVPGASMLIIGVRPRGRVGTVMLAFCWLLIVVSLPLALFENGSAIFSMISH